MWRIRVRFEKAVLVPFLDLAPLGAYESGQGFDARRGWLIWSIWSVSSIGFVLLVGPEPSPEKPDRPEGPLRGFGGGLF
jgi:hypothetical protein